jgi:hypothetical protein
MTDQNESPRSSALQEMEAELQHHRREQGDAGRGSALPLQRQWFRIPPAWRVQYRAWRLRQPSWLRGLSSRIAFDPRVMFDRRHSAMRRVAIGVGATTAILIIVAGAVWWRLASGPISLDVATPWLTAAIEQNFGSRYRIQVGGTQLERDDHGRTALRLRDIMVRDSSGSLVAAAPKAEVGIAGSSLLFGNPRAESFRLVDAKLVIHIEDDGRANVFAGGEKPLVTIAPVGVEGPRPPPSRFSLQTIAQRSLAANAAAVLAWIDRLGGLGRDGKSLDMIGFDGKDLTEIGISNGSLTVHDRRDGWQWTFQQLTASLIRPASGGVTLSMLSESQDKPWLLNAALTPRRDGNRLFQLQARKVPFGNLFALHMESGVRSDMVVSATMEANLNAEGTPQLVRGTVLAENGEIGFLGQPDHRIPIGAAEFGIDWDISRGTVRMPFKVQSGSTRISLRAEFASPAQSGSIWQFAVGGGVIVLDPLPGGEDDGLMLRRVLLRGTIDPTRQRVTFDHGDLGTKEFGGRDLNDVSIALSGNFDFGNEPRLALGMAGNQMSVAALKRLWPVFIAPKVRDWLVQHTLSGTVERIEIAANMTVAEMQPSGPPVPNDGLSVDIAVKNMVMRPVDGLPPLREADLSARITGRTAVVTIGKSIVDVSPGRRLVLTNGVFEVPDTHPKEPPARVRFRLDAQVPAVAELVALERLRDFSGAPFDPAQTRGTVSAQVNLSMPLRPDLPKGSTAYNIAADVANFSAEKMMFNQKVEAQTLRFSANNQEFNIWGDVRIGGTPAQVEYRRVTGEPEAEVRLAATLDDAARSRLGLNFGSAITGLLSFKLNGRVSDTETTRLNVETDLTPLKVDSLLPGWVKPAGSAARAVFAFIKDKAGMRFNDLLIDGPGILARGSVELDSNGDMQSANFPVFATSDGDKVTLRADRGPDGALRVALRGDVYDGRTFVKSAMSGPPNDPKNKSKQTDVDLEIKVGVVAGHHGEALRGLDLRMSRRNGRVRSLSLNAKIGRDTALIGDMRTRTSNGRPVMYFETSDAGALFRFTDVYPRIVGGKIWIVMDPPNQDAPQAGLINLRDFQVRGENALENVVQNAPQDSRQNVEFTQARAEFTRSQGRTQIRDGVVKGPMIGATMEGLIDYGRDEVSVRGTLVPLYGLNNMFGQLPIVGLFLGGGSNEGLLGITYEVTGSPSNPKPIVNPISAIAPGLLRKLFEFREGTDRTVVEPTR